MAEKKDKLMQDFLAKKWEIGDKGKIKQSLVYKWGRNPDSWELVVVKDILPYGKLVINWLTEDRYDSNIDFIVEPSEIKRYTFDVGSNPFVENAWDKCVKTTNYSIQNILLIIGESVYSGKNKCEVLDGVEVPEVNFNPYVFNGSEKLYYQRDFCWTLKDKQSLIESIYQYVNCGMILLRARSYKYIKEEIKKGNKEVAFWDVVDGKQRLSCLIDFINDRFTDLHGNYFSDLSERAQREFSSSQCFTFGEMGQGTTDKETIDAFIHVNISGKPTSQNHLDYVKSISEKL